MQSRTVTPLSSTQVLGASSSSSSSSSAAAAAAAAEPAASSRYAELASMIRAKNESAEVKEMKTAQLRSQRRRRFFLLAAAVVAVVILGAVAGTTPQRDSVGKVAAERHHHPWRGAPTAAVALTFAVVLIAAPALFVVDLLIAVRPMQLQYVGSCVFFVASLLFLISRLFIPGYTGAWVDFVAFALFSSGGVVVAFVMVLAAHPQVFAGQVALSIGLLLITLSALAQLVVSDHGAAQTTARIGVAAPLIVIVATLVIAQRCYVNFVFPILNYTNYLLFGVMMYGTGAAAYFFLALKTLQATGAQRQHADAWHGFHVETRSEPLAVFAASCFFGGAFVLLVDSARKDVYLDTAINDHFLSTLYVANTRAGATILFGSAAAAVVGSAVFLFSLFFGDGEEGETCGGHSGGKGEAHGVKGEIRGMVYGMLVGIAVLVMAWVGIFIAFSQTPSRQLFYKHYMRAWQQPLVLSLGAAATVVALLVYFFSLIVRLDDGRSESATSTDVQLAAMALLLLLGAVPLLGVAGGLTDGLRRGKIFHPSNYLLLIFAGYFLFALFFLVGAAVCTATRADGHRWRWERLGAIVLFHANVLLLLHAQMVHKNEMEFAFTQEDEEKREREHGGGATGWMRQVHPLPIERELSSTTLSPSGSSTSLAGDAAGIGLGVAATAAAATFEMKSYDVLIVGAGPAGLAMAHSLGLRGVKVLLVEKRRRCIIDSRAVIQNSNTCEILEQLGLIDDYLLYLRERSPLQMANMGSMWLSGMTQPDAHIIEVAAIPGRDDLQRNLPFLDGLTESAMLGSRESSQAPLRIMQSHQEEFLLTTLLQRYPNVTVMYGTEMVGFSQDDTQVAAMIRRPVVLPDPIVRSATTANGGPTNDNNDGDDDKKKGGNEAKIVENVVAKYMCACEGPGGVIAKKIEAKFDGFLNIAQTMTILFRAPGLYRRVVERFGVTHQYQVTRTNPARFGNFVAMNPHEDVWVMNVRFQAGPKKEEPYVDIIHGFIGADQPVEIITQVPWYMNFFIAKNLRHRRVFLVGDSAHSWPPFGGIGANTAYGDCENLGWKLALAVKGLVPDSFLDSYNTERRQVILRTALYVIAVVPQPKLILTAAGLSENAAVLPYLRLKWRFSGIGKHNHNHFCQSGIQMGHNVLSPVNWDDARIADDPDCDYRPKIHNGCRAPLINVNGEGVTLFQQLNRRGFTLVSVEPQRQQQQERHAEYENEVATFFVERGVSISIVKVSRADILQFNKGCRQRSAHLYLQQAFVLIRPDRIVAYHALSADTAEEFLYVGDVLLGHTIDTQRSVAAKSYVDFMNNRFLAALRPLKKYFPHAISILAETKEQALAKVRRDKKVADMRLVTKSDEEK